MLSHLPPTRVVAVFLATSVPLHWAWEVAHGPAYLETNVPLVERMWHCAPMAVIDGAWSASILVVAYVVSVRIRLPRHASVAWMSAALGALTAIAFERWATGQGRWTYNERMPVLPVVAAGLWPVLQMSVISPVSYLIAIGRWRSQAKHSRQKKRV